MRSLTFTLREGIVAISTLLTIVTGKVYFARTLAIDCLTVITVGTVQIALTFSAIRITVVAVGTGLAIWWLEGLAALTTTRFFFAMAGGEEEVALTS